MNVSHNSPPGEAGAASVNILETERLNLRRMDAGGGDAAFILELLNEPSFLHHIGDKGVRTIEDAVLYIQRGPLESYARHGFGLWLVELKDSGARAGICGLVKRETLPDADIGYAFLPRFWSRGYAYEAAAAVKAYAASVLGLARLLAIVSRGNTGSVKVLEKIGLKFERLVSLSEGAPEIMLFTAELEKAQRTSAPIDDREPTRGE